jgi:hypothetical protein
MPLSSLRKSGFLHSKKLLCRKATLFKLIGLLLPSLIPLAMFIFNLATSEDIPSTAPYAH